MEKYESQLIAELILDVKKDVSDLKREVSEVKAMAQDNSVILAEHMRRTEASEGRLDVQEKKFDEFVDSMEPVKEHVKTIHLLTKIAVNILKVMGLLASVAGVVKGLLTFR
jgi:hypothetical protein